MTDFTADITFGFPLNQVTTEADCLIKRRTIVILLEFALNAIFTSPA